MKWAGVIVASMLKAVNETTSGRSRVSYGAIGAIGRTG
jgi:hypothetical protein